MGKFRPIALLVEKKHFAVATYDASLKHMFSIEEGNKDILISFLNAIVPGFQDDPITHFLQIPSLQKEVGNETFSNLIAYSKTETSFIIDLHSSRQVISDHRAISFASNAYWNQAQRDILWPDHLRPVISIQVLDYEIKAPNMPQSSKANDQEQHLYHYIFQDERSSKQIRNVIDIFQLHLSRARMMLHLKGCCEYTSADWWMELLCNSSEYSDRSLCSLRESGVTIPPFFTKAMHRLDMSSWDPVMRSQYDLEHHSTDRKPYASVLAAEKAEAAAEGRAEGRAERRAEIALDMSVKGYSEESIDSLTGIGSKQLAELLLKAKK